MVIMMKLVKVVITMSLVNKYLIPTIFFFLVISSNSIANSQRRVVDNDFPDNGVAAELYLQKGTLGKATLIALSGPDGIVSPHFDCDELDILKVLPNANSGYFRYEQHCVSTGNPIKLRRVRPFANLLINAKINLDNEKYGTAALALREASGFARDVNLPPSFATSLSNSSVLATAIAVGAPAKITVGKNGARLPEEVKEKIAHFQNKSQINSGMNTGQPTYETVRALTTVTPWALMSEVANPDEDTRKLLENVKDESSLQVVIESLSKGKNSYVFGTKYFDNIATH